MIPLLPSSTLTRKQAFVTEEWNTYFSDGRAATVTGGWKGILYANLAIIDPVTSYNFFANSTFDVSWLDGGASRTWYMALAAGMFHVTCSSTVADQIQGLVERHKDFRYREKEL